MAHAHRLVLLLAVLGAPFLAMPTLAEKGTCVERVEAEPPGGFGGPTSVAGTMAEGRQERAAVVLGYANADEILRIEDGAPVRRDVGRQMRLAQARTSESTRNRSHWLRNWRRRMGFMCARATEVLGYYGRCNLYRVEHGPSQSSWEKILIAIAEERMATDAEQRPPTAVNLLSARRDSEGPPG